MSAIGGSDEIHTVVGNQVRANILCRGHLESRRGWRCLLGCE